MQKALVIRWVYTQEAKGETTVPTLAAAAGWSRGKVSGGHAAAVEAVAAAEATTGGKYNIGKGKDHGQPAGEREK